MAVGATALIIGHVWLTNQRDVLKSASDAGAIAATLEMSRQIQADPDISDSELIAPLRAVAQRYVEFNLEYLPKDRLARAHETLEVTLSLDRANGTVEVWAEADLGGTLLSRHLPLLGGYAGPETLHTQAGVYSSRVPVEVVLAIDTSGSMGKNLDGRRDPNRDSRMQIVREAARSLVGVLDPNATDRIAVGVVPWHMTMRLDSQPRVRWARNGWAVYPRRRHYGATYRCAGGCTPPEEVQDLPSGVPGPWQGCVDEHRVTGVAQAAEPPPIADQNTTPARLAFAQAFIPGRAEFAYECVADPLPSRFRYQVCNTQGTIQDSARQWVWSAQRACPGNGSAMLGLTSDRTRIDEAIEGLAPVGTGTYSTLGVLWAHRMLSSSWKDVWGDPVHPLDPADPGNHGVRKAIVVLTDGEDNYCGKEAGACVGSPVGIDRDEACDVAKGEGSEILVIAAIPPGAVSGELADALRRCSSAADNPGGTYVFINNGDEESLRGAFHNIARQMQDMRKFL